MSRKKISEIIQRDIDTSVDPAQKFDVLVYVPRYGKTSVFDGYPSELTAATIKELAELEWVEGISESFERTIKPLDFRR